MIDIGALSSPEAVEARVVYVVGDIHGRLDLLQSIEGMIAADIEAGKGEPSVICHLGDYIDRGPQSAAVIERLSGRRSDAGARVFLKGNHEDRLIAFLARPAAHGPSWLKYGGRETFRSYGIVAPETPGPDDWEPLRAELAARLPASHYDFLTSLRLAFRWRTFLMVHAGLDPERPLDRQPERALMWIREPFLRCERDWGLRVIHGHVVVDEPEFRPNRIDIDTGAYQSGRLTCLVVGEGDLRVLQTQPQPIGAVADAKGRVSS
jgi:serine/threonine protein phosphatase 1